MTQDAVSFAESFDAALLSWSLISTQSIPSVYGGGVSLKRRAVNSRRWLGTGRALQTVVLIDSPGDGPSREENVGDRPPGK
jgi:hypothetical protein